MADWVECVPNFSEGRDGAVLDRLRSAIESTDVRLLDQHADPDHHRSVFTFVGHPGAVESGAIRAARVAVAEIDLRTHRGTHPRVGVTDVIPVVAMGRTATADCVDLARRLGERLWAELRVPVYFYGQAASCPARRRLEAVRKHGFENLAAMVRRGQALPDIGGPQLHPTAGACCVGVRKVMVAFNVLIAANDATAAKSIAKAVREASGGLPGIKALGVHLASAGCAQVSMNVTDIERTPVHAAFDAVCEEAAERGVSVLGSELVGLAPRAALGSDPRRLRIKGFHEGMLLENRLAVRRRPAA